MPSRRRLTAAALSVLTVSGLVAATPATAATTGRWRLQQIQPLSGTADYASLQAVAAVSASSAWGVGEISLQQKQKGDPTDASIVGHWTGTSWQRVAAPTLTTGKNPTLSIVRASHAAGVWVVGRATFGGRYGVHQFVSHRSGSRWVNHDLGAGARFADVRILGANDVWVLYTRSTTSDVGVGEHWNGRSWTKVRLPALPAGAGSGHWASAKAPGSGKLELLHFHGRSWTVVAGPKIPSGRTPYYNDLLVRGDSLFVLVGYIGGDGTGDNGSDVRLYERDAKGAWHQRLYQDNAFAVGITRTSAPGIWLLGDYPFKVQHIVGGKVVSTSPMPPKVNRAVTYLHAISGTAGSSILFAGGDSGYGARSAYGATYRP